MTATFSATDRLAVSPAEAAELLGASRRYVDRCIEAGSLASIKRGGRRFVTGRALEEFLADTPTASATA
jgi:excisionase family DNA binding protein